MKLDLVFIILLAVTSLSFQSASARTRQDGFSGVNLENVTVAPENLRNNIFFGDAPKVNEDALAYPAQSLSAVKFGVHRATEVQLSYDLHDQIMGSTEILGDDPSITLRHQSVTYFSQPDARCIVALILLFFLIQSRASLAGRTQTHEKRVRHSHENLRLQPGLSV
jgi:hypothetical protein